MPGCPIPARPMPAESPQEPVAENATQALRRSQRASLALFMAGFASFSLLYSTQPLLPEFAAEFRLSPATSSLALSAATASLAFSILVAGALSETLGRRGLMFASLCAAAILNLAAALAPAWGWLLAARTLEGFVMGGVPAVAMAYLAEETPKAALGRAMGLYVAGTAFGGMMGRVAVGMLTSLAGWRSAMITVALVDLVMALGFFLLLPRSRHFTRRAWQGLGFHLGVWSRHLAHPQLPALFMIGFLAMGVFVTVYNYAGFRLGQPPWSLNHAEIGLIFLAYVFGIGSSSLGGALADRYGRAPVMLAGVAIFFLGLMLTLFASLALIVAGIAVITAGFFMVHSVASAWVGRLAEAHKGHAASLYLLAYYLGSSVVGSIGGWFWLEGGWLGIVISGMFLLGVVLLLGLYMRAGERR